MWLNVGQHPDPEWRDRLRLIQEGGSQANTGPIQAGGFKVVRKGARRSQVSVLPEAHTYWGTEVSEGPYIYEVFEVLKCISIRSL